MDIFCFIGKFLHESSYAPIILIGTLNIRVGAFVYMVFMSGAVQRKRRVGRFGKRGGREILFGK